MGFLSNIVARLNGSSCSLNFAMLPEDDEKKEERCQKVGQEKQRSGEEIRGQGQKEEVVQRQFGTSSITSSCLTKRYMTNSVRKFPTISS